MPAAWPPSCAERRSSSSWTGGPMRYLTLQGWAFRFLSPLFPPSPSLPACLAHHPHPQDGQAHLAAPQALTLGTPPQVFVELNELMLDRSQEPHWRETARWIKFEEDVEEETERWGKPHVASLSFRSLLELRRTIAHGRGAAELGRHQAAQLLGRCPGARRGLAAPRECGVRTAVF